MTNETQTQTREERTSGKSEFEAMLEGTPFKEVLFDDQQKQYDTGLRRVEELVDNKNYQEALRVTESAIRSSYRGKDTPELIPLYQFVGPGMCWKNDYWGGSWAGDGEMMAEVCILGARLAKRNEKNPREFYEKAQLALEGTELFAITERDIASRMPIAELIAREGGIEG